MTFFMTADENETTYEPRTDDGGSGGWSTRNRSSVARLLAIEDDVVILASRRMCGKGQLIDNASQPSAQFT